MMVIFVFRSSIASYACLALLMRLSMLLNHPSSDELLSDIQKESYILLTDSTVPPHESILLSLDMKASLTTFIAAVAATPIDAY